MEKWECSVCGYIYDPAVENPGTAFDALPDSWFCPNCGVGKEFFKKID
ncbi:MAG: rubredoxin [Syntrophobacteraceae bacterium]